MIIFYPASDVVVNPVVILDALDSSDRFSDAEVMAQVLKNAPEKVTVLIPSIYSCSYEFEFSHNGIPLSEGLKTRFVGVISSPPSSLVSQFSPKFFTSAKSIDDMVNAFSKFANPQVTVTHAALVVRDQKNNYVSRSFIAYAAQIQPDPYGSTTTMVIQGAAIDDLLIKSEVAFILDKSLPLAGQLTTLLGNAGYTAVYQTKAVYSNPVSGVLFPPMQINKLLDEICLQNKLIPSVSGKVVTIYSQGEKPLVPDTDEAVFSFLGYKGALAWGIGIENYANIKFKTPYFDARLFQTITNYNDIHSAFFNGLVQNGDLSKMNSYDANIIRYVLRRSSDEIVTEVTATNNWLLAQMRVDGILETAIYSGKLEAL